MLTDIEVGVADEFVILAPTDFGPLEQISYWEFDGRRRKRVLVNSSTPPPKGRGLLGVDPERRFFTPPSKGGSAPPNGSR